MNFKILPRPIRVFSVIRGSLSFYQSSPCLRVSVVSLLLLLFGASLATANETERFLEGLRERRLFRVAQAYCEDQLARQKLDEATQATLTIEYMRTLSQHALYSPPTERRALWQAAEALAEKFPPSHPRKLVVDLQAALVMLAQGELARQEVEASGGNDFATAQTLLREAARRLEALDKLLAQQIAQGVKAAPPALAAEELFALQSNARFQHARARRHQALCYPAASTDRVALLLQAKEQLEQLQTQVAGDDTLGLRLKLETGICQRMQEDYLAATRTLNALLDDSVPLATQQLARAELARVQIATNQAAQALRTLQAGRASAEPGVADFEFAQLEAVVALWKQAEANQDTQNAGRYRQQAVEQLATLERQFGAYWGRRGEWLVIGSATAGDENLEILARTADSRFLKQQFDDETLRIYDQATQMALEAGNLKRYIELGYRAATVQHKRSQIADAAQRLLTIGQRLAERMPGDEALQLQAAAVHLQGVRWYSTSLTPADKASLIAAYEQHLQWWPTGKSHEDAAYELASVYEGAGELAKAADALTKVSDQHPKYAAARLASGRLLLALDPPQPAKAAEHLTAALAALSEEEAAQHTLAQALLVVALAAQPSQRNAAEQMLAKLSSNSPTQLLAVLDGLVKISHQREGASKDLAAMQLQAIALLQPQANQLNAEQKLALARIEVEALAANGERAAALKKYATLAKQHPQSAAIQEGYAALLAAAEDRESLTLALGQWRVIANRTRPQTDRWYAAKYQVALLNYRLGDKAQAAQLIQYLQATPPGLSGTSLERQFADLLQRCQ